MPENRQFEPGNPNQGNQPGQPPYPAREPYGNARQGFPPPAQPPQYPAAQPRQGAGRSQYSRFVDDQVRTPVPDQKTAPLRQNPIGYRQQQPGSLPPLPQAPVLPAQRSHNKQSKQRRIPIWARIVLSALVVLFLALGGVAAYLYFTFSGPISHIVGQQVSRSKGEVDPNQGHTGGILDNGRINILLLGSDTDQKFSSGGYLAQTDIIVTVDPATKQVGMLSIPRDFWINVPGYGMHKLDEAYGLGGVALSRLTIEQDFGIPINYYAWVGLDGFVKVIDTVGGIDIDVLHPIVDDNYPDDVGNTTGDPYALERLYIPPGPYHLTGAQALEYVRSRHADLVGDFGRSARQQQVLSQLKTKLYNPSIVGKLPDLAHALDGYVKTDMQLDQVIPLMNFARSVDQNKISHVILSPPYSQSHTLPGGTSVVMPLCGKIIPAIAQMFALGNNARCDISAQSGASLSPVASMSQTSSFYSSGANDLWQSLSQAVSLSAQSLAGGGNDLPGIHSLLNLMFTVVFDLQNGWQT